VKTRHQNGNEPCHVLTPHPPQSTAVARRPGSAARTCERCLRTTPRGRPNAISITPSRLRASGRGMWASTATRPRRRPKYFETRSPPHECKKCCGCALADRLCALPCLLLHGRRVCHGVIPLVHPNRHLGWPLAPDVVPRVECHLQQPKQHPDAVGHDDEHVIPGDPVCCPHRCLPFHMWEETDKNREPDRKWEGGGRKREQTRLRVGRYSRRKWCPP